MVVDQAHVAVLAVVPYFFPRIGGGETHLNQLSRELSRMGHCVTVLTLRLPGTAPRQRLDSIEIHRFGDSATGEGRERGYREILNHIREHEFPDTVLYEYLCVGSEHRTVLMAAVLTSAREKKMPSIIRIPSSGRITELRAQHPPAIAELKAANAVIALNPGIRCELLAVGVRENSIVHIPNGVYVDKFVPRSANRTTKLREHFGLRPNTIVFLSPSRLASKKRIPELLRLWGELTHRDHLIEEAELWIVGDDTLEAERGRISRQLCALASTIDLRNVRLLGGFPHDEMPLVYQSADVFVLLSQQEGMSNAMLEGMASGLSVVAPDTEAVTQLIQDGWNGYLFSTNDPTSCERAILSSAYASSEHRARMGVRNRARICSLHRMESVAQAFSDLFNRVWAESRDPR